MDMFARIYQQVCTGALGSNFKEDQSSEKEEEVIILGAVIGAFDVLYEQIEKGAFDVSLDDQEGEDES